MPYNTAPIAPRKEVTGQAQLPLARVKKIIAMDSDIAMCSNNAAFVITLATEMFIQHLAEQGHNVVKSEKKPRRNIQYRDLGNKATPFQRCPNPADLQTKATAVARHDILEFLTDIVPRTVPYKVVKARARARGNPLPGSTVEPGQTTLDSKAPALNGIGTNGVNIEGSTEDILDDDLGPADPSAQLEMEIRGMRTTSTGSIEPVNGSAPKAGDEKEDKDDVEMS